MEINGNCLVKPRYAFPFHTTCTHHIKFLLVLLLWRHWEITRQRLWIVWTRTWISEKLTLRATGGTSKMYIVIPHSIQNFIRGSTRNFHSCRNCYCMIEKAKLFKGSAQTRSKDKLDNSTQKWQGEGKQASSWLWSFTSIWGQTVVIFVFTQYNKRQPKN